MKVLHKIGFAPLGLILGALLGLPQVSLASGMVTIDFTGTITYVTDHT